MGNQRRREIREAGIGGRCICSKAIDFSGGIRKDGRG